MIVGIAIESGDVLRMGKVVGQMESLNVRHHELCDFVDGLKLVLTDLWFLRLR